MSVMIESAEGGSSESNTGNRVMLMNLNRTSLRQAVIFASVLFVVINLWKKDADINGCSQQPTSTLTAVGGVGKKQQYLRNATYPTRTSATNDTSTEKTQGSRGNNPKIVLNTEQDEKCKRMFEWSMMDQWDNTDASAEIDFENLPQTRTLRAKRISGAGSIQMSIKVIHKNLKLTVVDMRSIGGMSEPMQENLWHRFVSQYSSWVNLQIAERKFHLKSDRTVYLFKCEKGKTLSDLPPEWSKIGEVTCDESVLRDADVVLVPANDGFLWDLAWDHDFECHNSDMFKTFASLFVDKDATLDPLGCFISRQGRTMRTVLNLKETIGMMREIFPRVRVIHLKVDHTTDDTVDMLYECRVLFGVHGAGHMNAIFARPGVAVVEMMGNMGDKAGPPAYFRNVNMLLGQHYESIKGDAKHGMNQHFTVDLEEARAALERAKDHTALWIEEYGKWR
jgi:hypothetical protein|mmetsp:Transcript_7031/g.12612  ORF Transcript_7031/g.12612 Transcript_7031/m.12612 type:complete len:450 (-) Transcript_7031:110-1459(-)